MNLIAIQFVPNSCDENFGLVCGKFSDRAHTLCNCFWSVSRDVLGINLISQLLKQVNRRLKFRSLIDERGDPLNTEQKFLLRNFKKKPNFGFVCKFSKMFYYFTEDFNAW